ncbi:MAG: glycine--tRNA ligase subunit beta [Proteobacteria bacterium]|nr:glycine--tRNA ligase subunit beta [Pseudomonadota bacterium]
MPQLLLELFSEEIPARMQAQAARDLERMFADKLKDAGLAAESLKTYAGPRRLTLVAEGLPAAQEDRVEERKGPRANAPEQALEGFLRSTGLTRDQLVERDGVLFAEIARKGRPTPEIVAEAVDAIVRSFPWPKSMTWGTGTLRWVRPLKRILCLFGGAVVPFAIDGIASGDLTEGHRFMGPGQAIKVTDFASYRDGLQKGCVVLDAADRKATILEKAKALCAARGLELVDDEGLLDEVSGLAEWPTPILGDMDPSFLDLPAEVIRTSMRTHQKYFAVRDPKTGGLAPHFLAVANIEAIDGGKAIAAGNARVLSARLNDARFFWDEDNKPGNFERWLKKLEGVTFHAKLGTMAERVERIVALARTLALATKADPDRAEEAARLAKADLVSGMVGEFPELQGIMGGYYARRSHRGLDVVDAVRNHYQPQGPKDYVPTAPLVSAVALADKLDTLVSFFAIDEKPTGSRDPYALRRAALGFIRIVLGKTEGLPPGGETPVRLSLRQASRSHYRRLASQLTQKRVEDRAWAVHAVEQEHGLDPVVTEPMAVGVKPDTDLDEASTRTANELLAFFADRLKVMLRDEGKRHDLVDAVFALGDDDLVRIVARVEALDGFLKTDDGANLLAGYRRAVNILKAEAKKNPNESYDGAVDPSLLKEPEEKALADALGATLAALEPKLAAEDFTGAMGALAGLRGPVDAFFDKVLVNDPDAAVRMNRLRLLSQIKDAANRVADFSLISG